jgi:hypothetical protein
VPRLVVVLPLRPMRLGEAFSLRTWPLHVTVAPTFVTDADAAAVAAAIAPVVATTPAMSVTAAGEEGFGPSGRVPVTVLVPTPGLSTLHRRLIEALCTVGTAGTVFDDPEYTGPGYRAHVTVTAEARLQTDEVAVLRQAAIVDMEPIGPQRLRQVVWISELGGAG